MPGVQSPCPMVNTLLVGTDEQRFSSILNIYTLLSLTYNKQSHYTCMLRCVHAHTHAHTLTHTHTNSQTHVGNHTCMHALAQLHRHIFADMHTQLCTYRQTYTQSHSHTTHTHTHTHTHKCLDTKSLSQSSTHIHIHTHRHMHRHSLTQHTCTCTHTCTHACTHTKYAHSLSLFLVLSPLLHSLWSLKSWSILLQVLLFMR